MAVHDLENFAERLRETFDEVQATAVEADPRSRTDFVVVVTVKADGCYSIFTRSRETGRTSGLEVIGALRVAEQEIVDRFLAQQVVLEPPLPDED